MNKLISLFIIMLFGVTLMSCQKAFIDSEDTPNESNANVTFSIRKFEQIPFDKAKMSRAKDIKDVCSNLCFGIYSTNDKKRIKSENQKLSDPNFGTLSLTLDEGSYDAVIIAHNQSKNPTTTKPESIKIVPSKEENLSDVFFWHKNITVKADSSQNIDVDMRRIVAMVRIVTTDPIPNDVAIIQFDYSGGSTTINGLTGKGCVKSNQSVTYTISDDMKGKTGTFELYTIPRDDSQLLSIDITGFTENGSEVFEKSISNIAISDNTITIAKGKLFDARNEIKGNSDAKFTITTVEDEWETVETVF